MNQNENQLENQENLDFDELEKKLDADLESQFSDLKTLEEDYKQIGNPENLGTVIKDVVWEQFLNQIGVQGGKDFIKSNNGLNLDLSKDAHIQTAENFKKGKIASHNTKINYQQRYDSYQSNFVREKNGNVVERWDSVNGERVAVIKGGARQPFDDGRPKGSASVAKDHQVPVAEILRDAEANAYLTKEEQIKFANSSKNLYDLDSAANNSKRDHNGKKWMKHERNGQTPDERFGVDKRKFLKQEDEARKEYDKVKKEGEKRSIEAGNQSRKEEAFRIGGSALRAAVMALLADFVKSMIQSLVQWFMSAQKTLSSLIEKLKSDVKAFVLNLKERLLNAGNSLLTTILSAIVGPIIGTIKKAWNFIKQGYKSLKDAVAFLRDPQNKSMPFSLKMINVGKIVIAGLTAGGTIVLGEVIEKGLMTIPVFNIEIPLLGSLANILGIFLGALVSGIVGAIALNLINKAIANKQKKLNKEQQFDKKNQILALQNKAIAVTGNKLEQTKEQFVSNTKQRHEEAEGDIRRSLQNTIDNVKFSISTSSVENKKKFGKLFDDLDNL